MNIESRFFNLWAESAFTSLGLFWMAFWAFGLGYLISSMIQIFITKNKMKQVMGESGFKSISFATFFGFISSSCSFAALSTTRALFAKGAGMVPSLAFLLASTNLVVELGIAISLFLSWQFVLGEYLGGLLMILLMTVLVKLTLSSELEKSARDKAKKIENSSNSDSAHEWKEIISEISVWKLIGNKYLMEWKMVWKDVLVGFTVAGIIAVYIPKEFFQNLFIGSGSESLEIWQVILHSLIGPIAAFITFIGSMGNIPLAAVLFSNGVSFAGVMAFLFSDLVVFPVMRIQIKYYGIKMAIYIGAIFLSILSLTSVIMHYGFMYFDILPSSSNSSHISSREFFQVDYSFYLNLFFFLLSFTFLFINFKRTDSLFKFNWPKRISEKVLLSFTFISFTWVSIGFAIHLFV